jgi:hypothetical protein
MHAHDMTALLMLLLVLVLLNVAVLFGWGYDSRDGRDWQPRQRSWDRFADSHPGRDANADTDRLGGWTSSSETPSPPTSQRLAL